MVKRKQGLKAGNRNIETGKTIDLKAPSYKWLICRRCELNEVKVTIETVACVCSICMTRACDHMPRVIEPKKSLKVVNTFERNRAKEEKEATLAATFKEKKASLKDEVKPKKKLKKKILKKKVPKKTRKKRVARRKSKK